MAIRIRGTGSYSPERVIDNDYLSTIVETSDEWVADRTGIRQRKISEGEKTTDLAAKAAQRAIENSGMKADELDLIVVATTTPDSFVPNTASVVQNEIGALHAMCFELNSACSGFLTALNTAYAYIESGMYKNALIIGAETLSKIIDWTDRSTCVLFGDGAGAAVVEYSSDNMFYSIMGSDGGRKDALTCGGRPLQNLLFKENRAKDYVKMDGQEIFKFVIRTIPTCIQSVLSKAGLTTKDIRHFIMHQANARILKSVAKKLEIDQDKMPSNVERYGNTSAASIPLLLDEMNRSGKLVRGDKIIISGFGGGLSWGAALLIW